MKTITTKKIDDFIRDVQKISIAGHIKPDGDCIGSVLALYNYLEKNYPEKQVDVYLENPGEKYKTLKNFDRIHFLEDPQTQPAAKASQTHIADYRESCKNAASSQMQFPAKASQNAMSSQGKNLQTSPLVDSYDLMITLDCSTLERLGGAQRYFQQAAHTICLDHHVSNEGFTDENYIYGDLSSACEVLYHFLDPEKLDREIAICLYQGIIADTGVFKYSCTSPDTMRVAAELMEYGVPTERLIDDLFYAKTWNENRILGYAVMNSVLSYDGRVIYSYITRKKMEEFHVTTRDLEGIVAQLRLTRGVQCALFLYETAPNEYKVSLRSIAPFDVNAVAGSFGGGGHVRAAGCNVVGDLHSCIEALLIEISRQLEA